MSSNPAAAAVSDKEPKRVSFWIKLFVAFHIIAITSWALPKPPDDLMNGQAKLAIDRTNPVTAFRSAGNYVSNGTLLFNQNQLKDSPLKFYLLFTGFWQYWDMFSPNPASTDFYGTAEITYKDGRTLLYTYPRMYEMGMAEKYVSERYRKFYERAHPDLYKWIWPTFAQVIALKNYTDPSNPPVKVALTRHWLPIAPPGKPQQPDYSQYTYYTHKVDFGLLNYPDVERPLLKATEVGR